MVSEYEETKEWVEMAVSNAMTYLSILKTDLLKRSQSALNAPQGFSFPLPLYKDHVVHFAVKFIPVKLPISMFEAQYFTVDLVHSLFQQVYLGIDGELDLFTSPGIVSFNDQFCHDTHLPTRLRSLLQAKHIR